MTAAQGHCDRSTRPGRATTAVAQQGCITRGTRPCDAWNKSASPCCRTLMPHTALAFHTGSRWLSNKGRQRVAWRASQAGSVLQTPVATARGAEHARAGRLERGCVHVSWGTRRGQDTRCSRTPTSTAYHYCPPVLPTSTAHQYCLPVLPTGRQWQQCTMRTCTCPLPCSCTRMCAH
jgi:hypothetical protein